MHPPPLTTGRGSGYRSNMSSTHNGNHPSRYHGGPRQDEPRTSRHFETPAGDEPLNKNDPRPSVPPFPESPKKVYNNSEGGYASKNAAERRPPPRDQNNNAYSRGAPNDRYVVRDRAGPRDQQNYQRDYRDTREHRTDYYRDPHNDRQGGYQQNRNAVLVRSPHQQQANRNSNYVNSPDRYVQTTRSFGPSAPRTQDSHGSNVTQHYSAQPTRGAPGPRDGADVRYSRPPLREGRSARNQSPTPHDRQPTQQQQQSYRNGYDNRSERPGPRTFFGPPRDGGERRPYREQDGHQEGGGDRRPYHEQTRYREEGNRRPYREHDGHRDGGDRRPSHFDTRTTGYSNSNTSSAPNGRPIDNRGDSRPPYRGDRGGRGFRGNYRGRGAGRFQGGPISDEWTTAPGANSEEKSKSPQTPVTDADSDESSPTPSASVTRLMSTEVPTESARKPYYLSPKSLVEIDERTAEEVLKRIREGLLQTTIPIPYLLRPVPTDQINHLYTIIRLYFNHLASRMKMENVTYLNLIDITVYSYDDFCSYGSRFIEFVQQSGLFKDDEVHTNLKIFKAYIEMHPGDILQLRTKMLDIKSFFGRMETYRLEKGEEKPKAEISVDYKMVTYKSVDPRVLYASLSLKENVNQQIAFFLKSVRLTDKGRRHLERFIKAINDVLNAPPLAELKPVLLQFGSLVSGLASYDSDLDLAIRFDFLSDPENVQLDYSTSMLSLGVIAEMLERKLGIRSNDRILIPSRRCPIIQLDFYWCFPEIKERVNESTKLLEFNSCDISVNRFFGMYNTKLFKFLAEDLEPRFQQCTVMLKYWAKKQNLTDRGYFTSYGWTLMVMFYLQNTEPPVLPSVERLQQLAREQGKEEILLHGYRFDFCDDVEVVGKSENTQSTAELMAGFFKFYYNFNTAKYAIVPRLGAGKHIKEMLYQEKNRDNYRQFKHSYFTIEDPFVLDHNVGSSFRESYKDNWMDLLSDMMEEHNVTAENVITVITDPEHYCDGLICE